MTVTNMIGLVLADDHRVFAEGLGVMLDAQDDLAVLGVAHDAHQAVELAAKHEPMVLLLDAHMPGADLASTLRAVKAASPASKVLMLSADTRKETITEALHAGADGFLAKDASSRQVASAIRSLARGRTGMVITAASPWPTSRKSIRSFPFSVPLLSGCKITTKTSTSWASAARRNRFRTSTTNGTKYSTYTRAPQPEYSGRRIEARLRRTKGSTL